MCRSSPPRLKQVSLQAMPTAPTNPPPYSRQSSWGLPFTCHYCTSYMVLSRRTWVRVVTRGDQSNQVDMPSDNWAIRGFAKAVRARNISMETQGAGAGTSSKHIVQHSKNEMKCWSTSISYMDLPISEPCSLKALSGIVPDSSAPSAYTLMRDRTPFYARRAIPRGRLSAYALRRGLICCSVHNRWCATSYMEQVLGAFL